MNSFGKASLALALLASFGLWSPQPAAAQKTYVAVGDSLAYGFKNFNPTPNQTTPGGPGFPGYASLYQADLTTQTGTTYNLLNLGIVGETTRTLFTSALGSGATNASLNSHYATGSPTQAGLLHTTLTTLGSDVGVVTIQVGANDVLQAFETGGLAAVPGALTQVQSNYTTLLTQIKADEGGGALSNVTIVGYYDPYASLSPTSPYAILRVVSPGATASLNAVLLQEAAAFGARYVDLAAPFAAHLPDYDRYVLANSAADAFPDPTGGGSPLPNDHPTDLGYALIAQTLAAPEPSAPAVLGLGVLSLGALALRSRQRRA